MTDQRTHWPVERRAMPAHLAAQAAANPGGWVYEIDGSMVADPDGYVPAEAIIGGFAVGRDGLATGEYARNPGYGPVRHDFSRLETADHWLGWLPDTPARSVRAQLQAMLAEQVPGSVLEWVKIIDEPGPRGDRTWLDVNITRGRAEELLTNRIYQVDAET